MPIDPKTGERLPYPGEPGGGAGNPEYAGSLEQQVAGSMAGGRRGIPPELLQQLIEMLLGMAPENPIPGMAQGGPQPIDPELAMLMQQLGAETGERPGAFAGMPEDVQRRQVGSSPVPTAGGPMPRQQETALSPEEIQMMLMQDRGAGKFGR
jgi:hypothetical protein